MKAILALAALSMIAGQAQAENTWFSADELTKTHLATAAIMIDYDTRNPTFFMVTFDARSECEPAVHIGDRTGGEEDILSQEIPVDISFRVDKRIPWNVTNPKFQVAKSWGTFSVTDVADEFLEELTAGNTLRAKVDNIYRKFPLKGSSKAINDALILCFTDRDDTATYFN